MNPLIQLATRLHRDTRGDIAQTIMILAVIAIPLVMLGIAFGTEIANWLREKWGELSGQTGSIPTSR